MAFVCDISILILHLISISRENVQIPLGIAKHDCGLFLIAFCATDSISTNNDGGGSTIRQR